jgi:hypothetical protein
MTRYLLVLNSDEDRQRAMHYVKKAPDGTRVEFKASKRTLDQNSKMWSMLSDVSEQLPWHGVKLRPDDWKMLFLDALKRELRMVPNIDGNGFINLGRSSSDLSKGEMADLIELISAFGTEHGVAWSDPAASKERTHQHERTLG